MAGARCAERGGEEVKCASYYEHFAPAFRLDAGAIRFVSPATACLVMIECAQPQMEDG